MGWWLGVRLGGGGGSVSMRAWLGSLSDSTARPALTCAPPSAAPPHRRAPNPIDEMADAVRAGPLLLLRRLRDERAAVRVVTRHERGLRGVATGTLVAFDKHLNLVLRDVEESYTVLVRARRTTAAGGERCAPKQERRTRRLKQVMLMGSGVVLIGALGQESVGARREV